MALLDEILLVAGNSGPCLHNSVSGRCSRCHAWYTADQLRCHYSQTQLLAGKLRCLHCHKSSLALEKTRTGSPCDDQSDSSFLTTSSISSSPSNFSSPLTNSTLSDATRVMRQLRSCGQVSSDDSTYKKRKCIEHSHPLPSDGTETTTKRPCLECAWRTPFSGVPVNLPLCNCSKKPATPKSEYASATIDNIYDNNNTAINLKPKEATFCKTRSYMTETSSSCTTDTSNTSFSSSNENVDHDALNQVLWSPKFHFTKTNNGVGSGSSTRVTNDNSNDTVTVSNENVGCSSGDYFLEPWLDFAVRLIRPQSLKSTAVVRLRGPIANKLFGKYKHCYLVH